jgi:hypothetical protein
MEAGIHGGNQMNKVAITGASGLMIPLRVEFWVIVTAFLLQKALPASVITGLPPEYLLFKIRSYYLTYTSGNQLYFLSNSA